MRTLQLYAQQSSPLLQQQVLLRVARVSLVCCWVLLEVLPWPDVFQQAQQPIMSSPSSFGMLMPQGIGGGLGAGAGMSPHELHGRQHTLMPMASAAMAVV